LVDFGCKFISLGYRYCVAKNIVERKTYTSIQLREKNLQLDTTKNISKYDEPTPNPTQYLYPREINLHPKSTKPIYLWEINLHLTQQREINLQPNTTKTIYLWEINLHLNPTNKKNNTYRKRQH
jgi:hypothetical protein